MKTSSPTAKEYSRQLESAWDWAFILSFKEIDTEELQHFITSNKLFFEIGNVGFFEN